MGLSIEPRFHFAYLCIALLCATACSASNEPARGDADLDSSAGEGPRVDLSGTDGGELDGGELDAGDAEIIVTPLEPANRDARGGALLEHYETLRAQHGDCERDEDCAAAGGVSSCDCEHAIGAAMGDGIRADAVDEANRDALEFKELCEDFEGGGRACDSPPVDATSAICVSGRCETTQYFFYCFASPLACATGQGPSAQCDIELCPERRDFEIVVDRDVQLQCVCDSSGSQCFAGATLDTGDGTNVHLSFDESVLADPSDEALRAGFRALSGTWSIGEGGEISMVANDTAPIEFEIDHGTFVAEYSAPAEVVRWVSSNEASCVTGDISNSCACDYTFDASFRVAFRIRVVP